MSKLSAIVSELMEESQEDSRSITEELLWSWIADKPDVLMLKNVKIFELPFDAEVIDKSDVSSLLEKVIDFLLIIGGQMMAVSEINIPIDKRIRTLYIGDDGRIYYGRPLKTLLSAEFIKEETKKSYDLIDYIEPYGRADVRPVFHLVTDKHILRNYHWYTSLFRISETPAFIETLDDIYQAYQKDYLIETEFKDASIKQRFLYELETQLAVERLPDKAEYFVMNDLGKMIWPGSKGSTWQVTVDGDEDVQ